MSIYAFIKILFMDNHVSKESSSSSSLRLMKFRGLICHTNINICIFFCPLNKGMFLVAYIFISVVDEHDEIAFLLFVGIGMLNSNTNLET